MQDFFGSVESSKFEVRGSRFKVRGSRLGVQSWAGQLKPVGKESSGGARVPLCAHFPIAPASLTTTAQDRRLLFPSLPFALQNRRLLFPSLPFPLNLRNMSIELRTSNPEP